MLLHCSAKESNARAVSLVPVDSNQKNGSMQVKLQYEIWKQFHHIKKVIEAKCLKNVSSKNLLSSSLEKKIIITQHNSKF